MNPKITGRMVSGALALFVMLGGCWQAQAQAPKTPYPRMAPLDQYLMADRNAEIALARSAAPDSITVFLVPVEKWSDGTAASTDSN
jgi:hypothetical protein